ncbi:MAG: phosphoglycerate kinase [Phycisphaerales bacterium]|nr:phosphoglycerate kinase [Hyphomonadaceae bacterium]
MSFRRIEDAPSGTTALVRVDFNVPMKDGVVTDDTRLRAALPTIQALRERYCQVILVAHFDRPKGQFVSSMSLRPIVEPLSKLTGTPVVFVEECVGEKVWTAIDGSQRDSVILLENVRFEPGEESNDPAFAKQLAEHVDIYVNDAFSTAHRAHASTEGVAHILPAYAGKQMERELDALEAALGNPKRPVMGIVGGSKVSTKIDLLKNLVTQLDKLAIGGGMANTFLFAQGYEVGASYCEKDEAETARAIMKAAKAAGCELLLPVDTIVSVRMEHGAPVFTRALGELDADERILDAGPATVKRLLAAMDQSATLIWNGPLGVFEIPPFDAATVAAAKHAAALAKAGKLIAVAGGGDTVAALNHAGVVEDMTFVSTAGGAFLEWMEGKPLPGVEALRG